RQNRGGAVPNVSRGRVRVLIVAGLSPVTAEGELPGGRNEFIHWLQDTADQAGIVRGYVKYAHEIRTGRNARQLVHRALQIARSEPAGPAYLVAGREVMEETVPAPPGGPGGAGPRPRWGAAGPTGAGAEVGGRVPGAT